MPKLHTTFMPEVELDVDDAEAANLRGLGVVLDKTTATTETGLRKAAERQIAATTDNQPEG